MVDGQAGGFAAGNDWRLLLALAVNAVVLWGAWRLARGRGGKGRDKWAVAADAGLAWVVVQYVSVGMVGVMGLMNAWTILAVGTLLGLGMAWAGGWRPRELLDRRASAPDKSGLGRESPERSRNAANASKAGNGRRDWMAVVAALFLVGYLAGLWALHWENSDVSDDALTYHLPAAVEWLRAGRIVLHETWYFNPANTYSPLGGSAIIAWWYAPMGKDLLARFVQFEGVGLIFLWMVVIGRTMGLRAGTAALVALAAVLSRPIVNQAILVKDDLLLAGAFLAVVGAVCVPAEEGDEIGPWRLGAAIGLMLSIKVTAVLAAPMLLLGVDALAKKGWGWRRWGIGLAIAVGMFGPWYVRNAWLTGNPFFPAEVLGMRGLFRPGRGEGLETARGVWRVVVESYGGVKPVMAVVLVMGWVGAVVLGWRRVVAEPLVRVCVVGPVVGAAVFVAFAPYAEVRFLYPALLLLFAASAVGMAEVGNWMRCGWAGLMVAVSLWTGFAMFYRGAAGGWALMQGRFVLWGVVAVVLGMLGGWAWVRMPRVGRTVTIGLAGAVVVCASYTYADVMVMRRASTGLKMWGATYGQDLAEAWGFVRYEIPAGKVVAYGNTYLVYPLMGDMGDRRVVYAPVRPGVRTIADLPELAPGKIAGERIAGLVKEKMEEGADLATWVGNLRRLGVDYVFVVRKRGAGEPVEVRLARAAGFEEINPRVGEGERTRVVNPAAVVFRVR